MLACREPPHKIVGLTLVDKLVEIGPRNEFDNVVKTVFK